MELKESVNKDVGLNISHLRKKAGLTQGELAEILGVSVRTVHNYENGKGLDPSLLEFLSVLFKCNLTDFFVGINSP